MESIKGSCPPAYAQDDGRRAWLRAGMSAAAVRVAGNIANNDLIGSLGSHARLRARRWSW